MLVMQNIREIQKILFGHAGNAGYTGDTKNTLIWFISAKNDFYKQKKLSK